MPQIRATVWSKDNCTYCVQAKNLLIQRNIAFEEKKIGDGYTKEDLLVEVPTAMSVPQIFLDGEYIGGFDQLKEKLK